MLNSKGTGIARVGLAMSILFVDGAFGKLLCGYLGSRIGMMKTVWITEAGTSLFILLTVWLPFNPAIVMLPLLGIALNGTSSALYGAVSDLAGVDRRELAFALLYTSTIGGGALSPVLFGRLGDAVGLPVTLMVLAAFPVITLPLSWHVQKGLAESNGIARVI